VTGLLDTHTYLWLNMGSAELSETVKQLIANPGNNIFVSAVTAWEISIKYAKGRLVLPEEPDSYIPNRLDLHKFNVLPIQISHTLETGKLPLIHADTFDRLLIAQSNLEKMPLLTKDSEIVKYKSADCIW